MKLKNILLLIICILFLSFSLIACEKGKTDSDSLNSVKIGDTETDDETWLPETEKD